ncbi:MAG: ATP-binding protein, partial [Deltaproteobacteria bacterium]|nr:ATP-binding protein [Deltaproteobacteria bacterium]
MSRSTIKSFNIGGPCHPTKHYMSPLLSCQARVKEMIEEKFYFILHVPPQSGKTTFLHELTDAINSQGQMYALYCSLELCQGLTDVAQAMTRIAVAINRALRMSTVDSLASLAFPVDGLPNSDPSEKIFNSLNRLCVNLDQDLVVFFDEVDYLTDAPLITFLQQIRSGYNDRFDSPASKFPRSMALVGLRDIRDYALETGVGQNSTGAIKFSHIKKEALTLPNFTQDE